MTSNSEKLVMYSVIIVFNKHNISPGGNHPVSLRDVRPAPSKFNNSHVTKCQQVGKLAETHVWDASTMKTVAVLKGFHKRGIICVDFSGTGGFSKLN